MDIVDGLQTEMDRCRKLIKTYNEIPTGAFGAAMIKAEIKNAESAIANGDIVKMIYCYKSLEECK